MSLLSQPIVLEDEYVEILRRVNAGMLHRGNVYCFDHIIKNLPSNSPILEIGTYSGLSANVIAYLLKKNKKTNQLISIEKFSNFQKKGLISESHLSYDAYWQFVKDNTIRNITTLCSGNIPFVIEATAAGFFTGWQNNLTATDILGRSILLGGKVAFVHIDGNHSYESVKADFMNADNILEENGFLFFDDSADDSDWEVKKLVSEIISSDNYQFVIKNPNYLFKKIRPT